MVQFHNPFHRHKARVTPDDKQQSPLKLSWMLHRNRLDRDKEQSHSRKRLAAFWRWPSLDQNKQREPKARWRHAVASAATVHNARGEAVPAEEMEAALQEREERVAAREARLERLLQDARIQSMGMEEARGVLDATGEVLEGDMRRLSGNRQTVNQGMAAARHALEATRGDQDDMREAIQAVASADRAAQHAGEWGAALAAVQQAADEPGPKRSGEGERYKEDRLVEAVIAGLQPPECGVHRAIVLRLHDEHHGQLYVAGASEAAKLSSARVKPDALWWRTSPHQLTVAAYEVHGISRMPYSLDVFATHDPDPILLRVLSSGEARKYASDADGDASQRYSLAPLRGRDGHRFGVLVSGPPHVHDELLAQLARLSGVLMERAWRQHQFEQLVEVAAAWPRTIAISWLQQLGSQQQKPLLQRVPTMLLPEQEASAGTPLQRRSWREAAEEMEARAQEQARDAAERGGDLFYVRFLAAGSFKYEREVAASHVGVTGGRGSKPWEAAEFSAFGSGYDNALSTVRLRLLHPNDSTLGMLVVESPSEKEGVQRPLPTHLLEVLGALAPALQSSAKEIFLMRIGDRPKVHVRAEGLGQAEGQAAEGETAEGEAAREGSAEWHARLLLPRKLQSKLRSQLAGIDRRNMYSELKSYRIEPSAEARKVMIAVMVLVGHGRWAGSDKVLTTWDDVQDKLSEELVPLLLELDALATGKKFQHEQRWEESAQATKGLDLVEVTRRAPNAIKVLLQWLQAARLVHSMALELRGEGEQKKESGRRGSGRRESAAAKTMQAAHRQRQRQRRGSVSGLEQGPERSRVPRRGGLASASNTAAPTAQANNGVADGGKTPDRGKGRTRRRSVTVGARSAAPGVVEPKDATARAETKPTVAPTVGGSQKPDVFGAPANFNFSSLGGSSHDTPNSTRVELEDATARAETMSRGKKPAVTEPAVASSVGGSPRPGFGAPTNSEFSLLGSSHGTPSGTWKAAASKQSAEERERLAQERSALRQVSAKIDTRRH